MVDTQWVDKKWVIRKQRNSRGNNLMENMLIIPLKEGKNVFPNLCSDSSRTFKNKMLRYSMYICIYTEIQQGYSFSAIKDQTIYMVVYLVKLRRDAKSRFIQDIICEELPCYLKEEFCAIMYCLTCTCISMSMSPSTM